MYVDESLGPGPTEYTPPASIPSHGEAGVAAGCRGRDGGAGGDLRLGPATPGGHPHGVGPRPLPADRYEYTPQDYQRSQRASALLIRQCMADRGHRDFPLDPRYPSDPIVATAVSTDYGALDLDSARRWGYGWDPAKHPAPGRRAAA